jgi:predicted nuclease of predicted toxin-antitoxin system
VKFLVDMPLSPELAVWLRERGHLADHASAIGLHNAKDQQIIEVARQQNRIIITADLDYPQLLAISRAQDPGVILFRGGSYKEQEMLRLLQRVLELTSEEKLHHAVTVVDKVRIRRCPLPID